jgi:hypothetical protein
VVSLCVSEPKTRFPSQAVIANKTAADQHRHKTGPKEKHFSAPSSGAETALINQRKFLVFKKEFGG